MPADVIETDPARWRAVTPEGSQVLSDTAIGEHIDIRGAAGYIATPLTGVWATAPYLHNGSVPTIWHLLNPDERPERFLVGGHALDYDRLGIAGGIDAAGVYRYPDDYEPWTIPEVYDTREPGRSSAGHDAQVAGLTEAEKRALIEFLKRL